MKLRKFLIIFAIMAVMMAFLAISASAVDMVVDQSHIESATKTIDGVHCWHSAGGLYAMFDGNIECAGSWYIGNGFALPEGESATITFKEELDIKSVIFYGWSNWSSFVVTFHDAQGNEVAKYENDGWQDTSGSPHDLEIAAVAKSMTMTTLDSKGLRNHVYTEFIITFNHEHKFETYVDMVKLPTCTQTGIGTYSCWCGEVADIDIDPTGEHEIVEEIVYRNGFNNPGFRGMACKTCDTQDTFDEGNELPALFLVLGYSANETTGAISFGFGVNYDAIDIYNQAYNSLHEELGNFKTEFGIVAASRAAFAEGNPLQFGGEGLVAADKTVIFKNCTSNGYQVITYTVANLPEAHADTEIILSAYVYNGLQILYVGNETSDNALTVTYNGVLSAAQ